jgi:crotonobetainyl-CoA:carnitine CoA-transferase CaiB-like acyl-CoA transferase
MVEYEGMASVATADDDLYGLNALYRHYQAADGWVFLAAPQGREWATLVRALMDYVDLASDSRFADEAGRVTNDAELGSVLSEVFQKRSATDWEHDLTAADVGCVAVDERLPEVILMSDDFGRACDLLVDVSHPMLDQHPRLAPLVRFSRSSVVAGPAPSLGQQTDSLLRELGYSDEAIADLRERNVVR